MAMQYDNIKDSNVADEVVFSPRELAVLNEIATVVSSATTIDDVYATFAALVADIIEWDGIILNVPTEDGLHFEIKVREGSAIRGREPGEIFESEGSLFGATRDARKTQIISVAEGQTAEWALKIPGIRGPLLAGIRSWMATPLLSQGNFLGAIYLQSFSTDAFTEHDQLLWERIATFVAPTIERFAAYDLLKQDSIHSKSLLRIGRLLLGTEKLEDAFEPFHRELLEVIEVDRIAIAVADNSGQAVVDSYIAGIPVEGHMKDRVYPLDSLEPQGLDVSSHGYIVPPETLSKADPVSSEGMYANYKAGLRSAMYAGLRVGNRIVGTINVKSTNDNAYSPSDLEYFEQVSDHLAAAIDKSLSQENAIALTQAEQERAKAQQDALRVVDVIQAKERLLTSASHELRTPLTGILAFVDLLARNRTGSLSDKDLRYLSIVRRNAEDLSGKVNSLIAHAARDAGELDIRLERFNLMTMMNEAITDVAPKVAELGQTVTLKVDDDLDVIGDRRQLLVALTHLIDNASRYAPKDSRIDVAADQVEDSLEISVSDQGTGVSEDHESDIFDPFERGELTGMANSPGAGLGLTYVRAVAIGHGGEAMYGKSVDGGAKFTISIPLRIDS